MGVVGGIIIYLLLWWTVLFVVLPWGVRGVWEEPDAHAEGVDPGAPQQPDLKKKLIRTTWISAILWVFVAGFIASGIISYE